jgi:hypothetical protein
MSRLFDDLNMWFQGGDLPGSRRREASQYRTEHDVVIHELDPHKIQPTKEMGKIVFGFQIASSICVFLTIPGWQDSRGENVA